MGDDGAAFGSCALALRALGVTGNDMAFLRDLALPYYGNQNSREEVERALAASYEQITFEHQGDNWPEATAELLAEGQIGAVFEGRMEWGPRALGNRSILANPCLSETRERLNKVVKKRPLFQPFCPAILIEERERLFERAYNNQHMTCAFRLRKELRLQLPGAIHIDGTARVQFVSANDNPHFHRLLYEFKRLSGFGVIINTSFNLHGRPIVNTPEDAICDFLASEMDFLLLEGYLVRRRKQAHIQGLIQSQQFIRSEFDDAANVGAVSER
jgi:carbamoyltransferase